MWERFQPRKDSVNIQIVAKSHSNILFLHIPFWRFSDHTLSDILLDRPIDPFYYFFCCKVTEVST